MGHKAFPRIAFLFAAAITPCVYGAHAQSNGTSALAGAGAGAALGGATSAAGATSSSAAGGTAAAGNAPIEIEIMTYQGLAQIAVDIASRTKSQLSCTPGCGVLLEDSTSSTQIAMYEAAQGYADQLATLYDDLQQSFSLVADKQALSFELSDRDNELNLHINVTNVGHAAIPGIGVIMRGQDGRLFRPIDPDAPDAPRNDCRNRAAFPKGLPSNATCSVVVVFQRPRTSTGHDDKLSASVQIGTVKAPLAQVIPISGKFTFHAPPNLPPAPVRVIPQDALAEVLQAAPADALGAAAAPAAGAASSTSSTPQWITNFGALGTAIEGLKSGMSYSSSSFQPTTQSFQVLLETALAKESIPAYTSTSALELDAASGEVTQMFSDMVGETNDINNWNATCKPAAPSSTTGDPSKPTQALVNRECSSPAVVAKLALAQTMITGYMALLQTTTDGAGNLGFLDILRGKALKTLLNGGLYSLQVNVAAAAGSTRNNAIFLLSIFYVPPPSYNAGVIATFELRRPDNTLIDSGARAAFFDYNKKWMGEKLKKDWMPNSIGCGAVFCAEKGP